MEFQSGETLIFLPLGFRRADFLNTYSPWICQYSHLNIPVGKDQQTADFSHWGTSGQKWESDFMKVRMGNCCEVLVMWPEWEGWRWYEQQRSNKQTGEEAGGRGCRKKAEGVQLWEPRPGFGTGKEGRWGPACNLPKKTSPVSVRVGTEPVSLGVPSTIFLHCNTISLLGKQHLSFILSTF